MVGQAQAEAIASQGFHLIFAAEHADKNYRVETPYPELEVHNRGRHKHVMEVRKMPTDCYYAVDYRHASRLLGQGPRADAPMAFTTKALWDAWLAGRGGFSCACEYEAASARSVPSLPVDLFLTQRELTQLVA